LVEEKIPPYIKMAMDTLYGGIGKKGNYSKYIHTNMPNLFVYAAMQTQYAHKLLHNLTVKQGEKYNDPASKKDIQPFVDFFGLNINESLHDIHSFSNFNEFFYRKLKPDARPIYAHDDPVPLHLSIFCFHSNKDGIPRG